MFYRVQEVTPKDNYTLSVLFTDGVTKDYDIKPLFARYTVFTDLRDIPGLYKQVRVDAGGYGISWTDDIDISSNELRYNGTDAE